MAKSPASGPGSNRLFVVGLVFGALTFMAFAGLLIASIAGHGVPQGDRYLVTILLAIGSGLSVSALGGTAALKGKLHLPVLGDSAPGIGATGGIAVMLIVLFFGQYMFPAVEEPTPAQVTGVRLNRVTGSPLANPPRVLVVAEFDKVRLPPEYRLFLRVASDPGCLELVDEGLVDNPLDGPMRLFIEAPRERVVCAQLVVKDATGRHVSDTPAQQIKW